MDMSNYKKASLHKTAMY